MTVRAFVLWQYGVLLSQEEAQELETRLEAAGLEPANQSGP
jgi:hypothetical protein